MSKAFESINDVLDFAIGEEDKAYQLYRDLAQMAENPAIKQTLGEFAREELGHKAKLEAARHGEVQLGRTQPNATRLKIEDYLVDVELQPDMDYADVLVYAMKKEKAAYTLYLDLAAQAETQEAANLFTALAQEEANHKLRFEIEYDDWVMQEN